MNVEQVNQHLIGEDLVYHYYRMQSEPIRYLSLGIEITDKCNAKCGICYQSAGIHNSCVIDVNVAKKCIREAASSSCMGSRFHAVGGEAFLYPDVLFPLFEEAKASGFTEISATTNCFWAKTEKNADAICARMKNSGVTLLEISWDFWHAQHNSAECINNCLIYCRKYGIRTNLRFLTTKSHSIEEALKMLDPFAVRHACQISSSNVTPSGRAVEVLPREEFYGDAHGIDGMCVDGLVLTINSYGEAYPCCAGFDTCRDCNFGNINDSSIIDIMDNMNSDPMLRQLVFLGPKSYYKILTDCGCNVPEENRFVSRCDFCHFIFSNENRTNIIRTHFEKLQQESIEKAIAVLEKKLSTKGSKNE